MQQIPHQYSSNPKNLQQFSSSVQHRPLPAPAPQNNNPVLHPTQNHQQALIQQTQLIRPIPQQATSGLQILDAPGRLHQPLPRPPGHTGPVSTPPPTPTRWFHGGLSREETERRLTRLHSGTMNGTFLIRYSSSTRKYVLSVFHEGHCYHYPIEELPDGFYQVSGTNSKYLGLDLLVSEFRRSATASIVCALSQTVVGGVTPPSHIIVYGRTHELHHAIRKANLKKVREVLSRNCLTYAGNPSATVAGGGCMSTLVGAVGLWDIINEKSADSGATPLIEAAKIGSNDIVKLLLEHGADMTLRDCAGFTALHRACQRSFAHIVETLCKRGNNVVGAPSNVTTDEALYSTSSPVQMKCPFTGNTALHEAAMLGHMDCCETLVRYHAAVWARNVEGEMPFELALRYGFRRLAEALSGYRPPQPLTTKEDWFHPNLSKSDTERILVRYSDLDGTFLVRKSSQSDRKFVLVIIYQSQALKYQIDVMHDFAFNADTKEAFFIDKGPLHLTLEHLVEHYSRFADGIPTRLRYALPVSVATNNKLNFVANTGNVVHTPAGLIDMERLVPAGVPQADREPLRVNSVNNSRSNGAVHQTHSGSKVTLSTESLQQTVVLSPNASAVTSGQHRSPPAPGRLVSLDPSVSQPTTSQAQQHIRLIASDAVVLISRLGEGEFGEVYSGHLHRPGGKVDEVAVKVLVQPSHRLDFLKEASIMMQLNHSHIIRLYGVCENKRLMMLLELAPLGSLLDYLLESPELCQLPQLYGWSMQIASGMCFLEESGFVHRDLACRNVLLQSVSCAKISDFGLSRAVGDDSDYYRATQRGKWPVKWYAPESIYYKHFSHASDVWSFGVCLWEMFSLGEHPYAEEDSFEVLRAIEEGRRLGQPALATDDVYTIMRQCWAYRAEARPTFQQLHMLFQHLSTNVYENVNLPENNNTTGR